MPKARFQAPKGTRDLYPEDMLRRRYVTQAWRDTSIRHGFEEIDGPTFETSDLYAVKSGDGILGELFQAFSGKDPKDLEFIKEHDRAQLALRPEFTPTLARLYAARAAQLPKPTKWFSIGPFFRAERPQRGRGREFLQWNADVVGDDGTFGARCDADGETIACSIAGLDTLGLNATDTRVHCNSRELMEEFFTDRQVPRELIPSAFALIDRAAKIGLVKLVDEARAMKLSPEVVSLLARLDTAAIDFEADAHGRAANDHDQSQIVANKDPFLDPEMDGIDHTAVFSFWEDEGPPFYIGADREGILNWCRFDPSIVRGLAYYTGTVFEVIAEGERAVAGGGRYDNLIELLGGPPTPAVGFAMGDVVLSLLLEDKNLMPEGQELLEACSRPAASLRPEAFVVTPDESLDPAVRRLVADLRRGVETEGFDGKPWASDRYETRPLHARRTYKSTRNIGKLLKDATGQHAKTLVIIENGERATVQDLDRKDKHEDVKLADVPALVARITA